MTVGTDLDAFFDGLIQADGSLSNRITDLRQRLDSGDLKTASLEDRVIEIEELLLELADHSHPQYALETHTHDGTPPPPPPPPPPPVTVFGRRELPRVVDPTPWYVAANLVPYVPGGPRINRDGRGHTITRSQLPYWYTQGEWQGNVLAGFTVESDSNRQTAIYAHKLSAANPYSALYLDLTFNDFDQGDATGHIGVIDQNYATGAHAINVTINGATKHGLEITGLVAGADILADEVAYAGNPHPGDLVRDSYFRFHKAGAAPNEWHYGAHKSGGRGVVAKFDRVEFWDGCSWVDVTAAGIWTDCLFEGSQSWGVHVEIDKWDAGDTPPSIVSYSTFRRNTLGRSIGANRHWFSYAGSGRDRGGSGNPSHVQAGHLCAHMGTVQADHCLFEADLTTEVVFSEWSDGRQNNAPSGIVQNAADTKLSDSLIVLTANEGVRRDGLLACIQHPDWVDWQNVNIVQPEFTRQDETVIVNNSGWKRLTTEQFIQQYASTCEVQFV